MMRRSTRHLQLLDSKLGQLTSSSYVCSSCSHRALQLRISNTPQTRYISDDILQRVRKKLWGTDNPPGLKDPYGPGFFDRRRERKRLQEEGQMLDKEVETAPAENLDEVEAAPRLKRGLKAEVVRPAPEVAEPDPTYKPAETWEGLEHVGNLGHWTEIEPRLEDEFFPFSGSTFAQATSKEEFLAAIHQATTEVCLLNQAGMRPKALSNLFYYDEETLDVIETAALSFNGKTLIVTLKDTGAEQLILDALGNAEDAGVASSTDAGNEPTAFELAKSASDVAEEKQTAKSLEIEIEERNEVRRAKGAEAPKLDTALPLPAAYPVENLDFLDLNITAGPLKFILMKRISQLVGHRIPDPVLTEAKSLWAIYIHLLKATMPKPKKLAETLLYQKDLADIPNVTIMDGRFTPVDKQKEVGRWKVIEAELRAKGLPVLGHDVPS